MTLKEKVNKFIYLQDVWVIEGKDVVKGLYVGYCNHDRYSVSFDYGEDSYVGDYERYDVFATKEEADKEYARRNIKMLENQINAIKKEYNL